MGSTVGVDRGSKAAIEHNVPSASFQARVPAMTMVAGQFHEVASAIARRTADLLRAPVWVADQHGAAITGSVPDSLAVPLHAAGRGPAIEKLQEVRLPHAL